MECRRNHFAHITTAILLLALAACDGKADDDALIGNWAASQADCESEWLALTEDSGKRMIEWWRTTDSETRPLPWRSGLWELRGGTIIMRFDHGVEYHRVEYHRFLQNRIDEAIDETVQFDVRDISDDAFRLVATTGGFSPEALLISGEEKLFVRCEK